MHVVSQEKKVGILGENSMRCHIARNRTHACPSTVNGFPLMEPTILLNGQGRISESSGYPNRFLFIPFKFCMHILRAKPLATLLPTAGDSVSPRRAGDHLIVGHTP
jgi:hypothetical protein